MKVACVTLGCRTNQHDTAEIQTLLEQEGFSIVNGNEKADAYVINTCTVTNVVIPVPVLQLKNPWRSTPMHWSCLPDATRS